MDLGWLLPKRLRPIRRPPSQQQQVDEETRHMALYHSPFCGYCLTVRRMVRRLNLHIELRNVATNSHWQDELRREGGSSQVPCLQIRHPDRLEWRYESVDIIAYLRRRFAC
jgi:glutathione S-transferase